MWTKSAELRQWTPDWSGWLGRLTETISPAWLWILILWFALVATPIVLRGFHYEEGTVIALARGAIEDGHWLAPHQYGLRFVERPALMSWLMALLGLLFGGIDQWVARILPTLSLLGGAALIFHLVRQRVSATAAVFGAFCFMLSPGLLQKSVTAEADAMLSVILFAAFVLWWDGKRSGRISAWRWFAIGLVLGCAALTKGPQPVAYFSFGIGAFIVVRRQWADLPGFILGQALAGACVGLWYLAVYTPGDLELWAAQGRLNSRLGAIEWLTGFGHYAAQVGLENLPGILLAAPLGFAALRQRKQNPDDLVLALLCYAAMCTIFIGLLPGRGPRYAMPASLAIAALAGIAYDALRQQRAILLDTAVAIGFLLMVYAVVLNWLVMPLRSDLFQRSWTGAKSILAVVGTGRTPVYAVFDSLNNNIIAYVRAPVRVIAIGDFARVQAPAFAFIAPPEAERVRQMRPDLAVIERAAIAIDTEASLYELRPK